MSKNITNPRQTCSTTASTVSVAPRTAPTEYRENGWRYRQLRRTGNIAIYSQGGSAAFEVVRIRTAPAKRFLGRMLSGGEYLPSTSEWGRHGWTFRTLREAEAKMAMLVALDQQNPEFRDAYQGKGPSCGASPALQTEQASTSLLHADLGAAGEQDAHGIA